MSNISKKRSLVFSNRSYQIFNTNQSFFAVLFHSCLLLYSFFCAITVSYHEDFFSFYLKKVQSLINNNKIESLK
jgi:hypothetical protein